MTGAHLIPRWGQSLENVRSALLALADTPELQEGLPALRQVAASWAARTSSDFDASWTAGRRRDGPIDVIDMFSGCGGMSAGFLAANAVVPAYKLALAVDINQDANRTYERNLGLRPVPADVGEIATDTSKLSNLLAESGRREGHPLVLIGCAPCQGFSSHRNGAGAADGRNNLFLHFARVAASLDPDIVVVENVPELLSDRHWPFVVQARRILEERGYHTYVGAHNMAQFGVPQERFRALMLAMKRPFCPPRGFLERGEFRTVRDAIRDLPRVPPGRAPQSDPMHFSARHRASTVRTIKAVAQDGGSRPPEVGPPCLRRAGERQGKPAYEDVYGRLWWDRPAITITAHARNPASGRYVHPEQHRGLTVREAALLQGFPRDYTFEGSFDSMFRQIGNAVPPVFAGHLAVHLLGELLASDDLSETTRGVSDPVGPSFARLIPALKAGHRTLEELAEAS